MVFMISNQFEKELNRIYLWSVPARSLHVLSNCVFIEKSICKLSSQTQLGTDRPRVCGVFLPFLLLFRVFFCTLNQLCIGTQNGIQMEIVNSLRYLYYSLSIIPKSINADSKRRQIAKQLSLVLSSSKLNFP